MYSSRLLAIYRWLLHHLCIVLWLVGVAALTSTISMHEIGTAFIYEEGKISRAKGAWVETIVCGLSQYSVPFLRVR